MVMLVMIVEVNWITDRPGPRVAPVVIKVDWDICGEGVADADADPDAGAAAADEFPAGCGDKAALVLEKCKRSGGKCVNGLRTVWARAKRGSIKLVTRAVARIVADDRGLSYERRVVCTKQRAMESSLEGCGSCSLWWS